MIDESRKKLAAVVLYGKFATDCVESEPVSEMK